jgi:AcrR family transcriptional regulator
MDLKDCQDFSFLCLVASVTLMADTSTSPTPTKGELTRRQILTAAVARFGRHGYRATSVADIARDAGVGGSVPYAYFAGKEALFLAAVDEDAAAVIHRALAGAFDEPGLPDWQGVLLGTLLEAVDEHPLARRLLAGLEPEVMARVMHVPALEDLRRQAARRLAADQRAGLVRSDIDPTTMADGIVAIVMSLLRAVVQLGVDATGEYADQVAAVLEAAVRPPEGR